ncbi:MAG: hypothetical protein IJY15_12170, partial [Thermoguttaceae bacterium]|nr:hypothetical protein [Thermoguttaceae bacterium]
MKRSLKIMKFVGLFAFAALFATACGSDAVWAGGVGGWRNDGMTICTIKLAILLVVYMSWLASTSWINNDAERLGDPDRSFWNGMNMIAFAVGMLAALFIPIFWAGLPVVIMAWIIPNMIYVKA